MSTELITVKQDEPLRIAVDHMSNGAVHSVLVVDDGGDLVGIVTSTDLIQQLGDLLQLPEGVGYRHRHPSRSDRYIRTSWFPNSVSC